MVTFNHIIFFFENYYWCQRVSEVVYMFVTTSQNEETYMSSMNLAATITLVMSNR